MPQNRSRSLLKRQLTGWACQAEVVDLDAEVEFVSLRRTPQILTLSQQKEIDRDPIVTRRGDRVFYEGEDIDRFRGHIYGLAIDVGTTTIVMDLVDLESGKSIAIASYENPQRFGGSDIMYRISYDGEYPNELWKALVNAINHEIVVLCEKLDFEPARNLRNCRRWQCHHAGYAFSGSTCRALDKSPINLK